MKNYLIRSPGGHLVQKSPPNFAKFNPNWLKNCGAVDLTTNRLEERNMPLLCAKGREVLSVALDQGQWWFPIIISVGDWSLWVRCASMMSLGLLSWATDGQKVTTRSLSMQRGCCGICSHVLCWALCNYGSSITNNSCNVVLCNKGW